MHLGAQTRATLVSWAMDQGATEGSAQVLARALLARWAGRETEAEASRKLLAQAEATFSSEVPEATPVEDPDGTIRYAVRLADDQLVEAVAIPHAERMTVCLSSQVGCARGCVFCETGRMGLVRNLEVHEITGQLAAVRRHLQGLGRPLPTNVVFMGMGEPLDNTKRVLAAAEVLSEPLGFAIAPKRITISTVGVVAKIPAILESPYRLALSLHVANDEERRALLPAARSWDLASVREAIAGAARPVFIQWTLIAGKNDTPRHLEELQAFCEGLNVRVNLIPLNPGPEDSLRAPPMEAVRAFQRKLRDGGIRTMVRLPHGQEVGGACGQLAGALRDDPMRRSRLPVVGRAPR